MVRPGRGSGILVGLAAFLLLGAVAAADGGYFPPAWSAATLALLWATAIVLSRGAVPRLGRLDWTLLAGLGALVTWIGLSIIWSIDAAQSVLELQRAMVYLAAPVALLLALRRRTLHHALGGTLAAIVLVCAYALATRLFPERAGSFDPVAGYRLFEPLGYWNALGICTAMGALVALGFASRARSAPGRALGAASLAVLLPTLYFTYSRGAGLALAVGVVALFAVDRRRLQLLGAALVVVPPALLAAWLGSRAPGLTRQDALLGQASREGHRLALWILLLGALAAVGAAALWRLEARLVPPPALRRGLGAAAIIVVVGALAVLVESQGGPASLARAGYDSFLTARPEANADLNDRLLSLSNNGRIELVEIAWDQYSSHALLGSGAGSFERYSQAAGTGGAVRDAHNLYAEILGELGWLGLFLLVLALSAPIVAGVACRGQPLVSSALGGFVTFVVHAAGDWDWEMAAVTLVALVIGGVLVVAARPSDVEVRLAPTVRAAVLAPVLILVALAIVALVGNRAIAAASDAALEGRWPQAEAQARRAVRWAPWSTRARLLEGQAQGAQGRDGAARATLREALERDARSWDLWFELARVSEGASVRRALDRAAALNPKSPEVAQFRAALTSP